MRLYPATASPFLATLARDAAVLLALIALAWLGFKVHDGVDQLAGLGRGVRDAGTSVQQGFNSAAGAVGGIPVIGGKLSDGLRSAGKASGGSVAAAGTSGEREVHRLANLLGWPPSGCRPCSSSASGSRPACARFAGSPPRGGCSPARSTPGAGASWPCERRSSFLTVSSCATRATRSESSAPSAMSR